MTKQPEAREPEQPLALGSSAVLGPARRIVSSTSAGMRVDHMLRCVARDWRTAKELRKSTGMDAGSLRNWLHALVDAKAVRMRNRPHEMQEDGNKPPGPEPREYKLSSKWSDLG